jgi:hypothetical protein
MPKGRNSGAIARQWLIKHIPAATNTQATIEVLLETISSSLSVQSDYKSS